METNKVCSLRWQLIKKLNSSVVDGWNGSINSTQLMCNNTQKKERIYFVIIGISRQKLRTAVFFLLLAFSTHFRAWGL